MRLKVVHVVWMTIQNEHSDESTKKDKGGYRLNIGQEIYQYVSLF